MFYRHLLAGRFWKAFKIPLICVCQSPIALFSQWPWVLILSSFFFKLSSPNLSHCFSLRSFFFFFWGLLKGNKHDSKAGKPIKNYRNLVFKSIPFKVCIPKSDLWNITFNKYIWLKSVLLEYIEYISGMNAQCILDLEY